ncbi:MAG: VWA domain-containing protein [Candidatus Acidiferrales bacterium]
MQRKPAIAMGILMALVGAVAAQRPQQPPVPPPPASKQQEPTIPIRVERVNVVFSVLNRRQKFITDLNQQDFTVLEDGKPQNILSFGRQTDLPLRVGILIDTSNSIRDRLKFEQEAAVDFIHNVVRRRKDMAFLMTFDSEHGVVEDFTDDAGKLTEAVMRQRAGGGTALYGGIRYACNEKLLNPPLPRGENTQIRRVLVVISDGIDTDPAGPLRSDAIEACQRSETAIYTVSTSTDWLSVSGDTPKKTHKTDGDKVLERFAEDTGGRAFFPYRIDDLARSFSDIDAELRSQYQITYEPANKRADGRFRKIEIEVERDGLEVRSRKGYFADSPRTGQPTAQNK